MTTDEKYEKLRNYIKDLGSAAVAFSGGADSAFLLKVTHEVLGSAAAAVTARGDIFPERETAEAVLFCTSTGIKQFFCDFDELTLEGFVQNSPDRCYLCKKELFSRIAKTAEDSSLPYILDGTNADDADDYRPGLKALAELNIKSPLKEAGLTKNEIRLLSKEMNLATWDKPSAACLASRIPYGDMITKEKMHMIDQAENFLSDLGLKQRRVRCHGNLARIETDEEGFEILTEKENRKAVAAKMKQLGFLYSAADLTGYRTGSLNDPIK